MIFILNAMSQNSEYVVSRFGSNMSSWTQTKSIQYRKTIEQICSGSRKIRVSDKICMDLAREEGLSGIDSYTLDTYLNCIFNKVMKGSLSIMYSNIRKIPVQSLSNTDSRGLDLVVCNVRATGMINYDVKDLFYVRDGKITKIDNYVEVKDETTGERKVKVDYSGIDFDFPDEAIGIMYNYGVHFPIGASVIYAWPWFMVSLDFGLADSGDEVSYTKYDVTNIMNYSVIETELKPKYYLTFTPYLNLQYVAIGCGVGCLIMKSTEHVDYYYSSYYSSSSLTMSISSTNSYDLTGEEKYKFMIRPSIKGFIPFNDEWSLVLSVGYDYVFKYTEKNGFNFGIGIQYSMDW